ncbi:hypothetical protein QBC33DRAFT_550769 [Phialemonium atrogriseum]|uniref:Subtilisin-like serine protease n=1 Tax=Phialemonium atrogriseum TaxID=1093897 RepID=A0AAJ0BVU7_9PEZI|nr:uncharacterized protein QBC33DRAFT_550769 [Phialemonium atrogriseum]KAK1763026.1 hypothetical protein QBC33DRAFT_550769 [Phialemonium atrogriseum]
MATAPFTAEEELLAKLTDPSIPDDAATSLPNELSCPVLDAMYAHLHIVARKSSSHIDALHEHVRKGRKIRITENPALHLVWFYDSVFVKPLPPQLLSYEFWNSNLAPPSPNRPLALGFVRSYAYLIRHRSDFLIAQQESLIPASTTMKHGDFVQFIKKFKAIPDASVSRRWQFGQFRLSRLNWAVRLLQPSVPGHRGLLHRLFYQEQYWQTGQFVHEFAAPLLFAFATLTLILAAMQVVLAARPDDPWPAFAAVSTWFSAITIIALLVLIVLIVTILLVILMCQIGFAVRNPH